MMWRHFKTEYAKMKTTVIFILEFNKQKDQLHLHYWSHISQEIFKNKLNIMRLHSSIRWRCCIVTVCTVQAHECVRGSHWWRSKILVQIHMMTLILHLCFCSFCCYITAKQTNNEADWQKQKGDNHQSSCVVKVNFFLGTSLCFHQCNIYILNCWKHWLHNTNTSIIHKFVQHFLLPDFSICYILFLCYYLLYILFSVKNIQIRKHWKIMLEIYQQMKNT